MTWKSERVFGADALEESVRQTVAIIRRVEGFELFPHLWRLLAEGQRLPLDRLAAASGWTVERVSQALSVNPSVEWDDQGRLVGFGLTLQPTSHKFTFEAGTSTAGARQMRSCSRCCWAGRASSSRSARQRAGVSGSRLLQKVFGQ